jgi:hypothetical protein
MCTLWTNIFLEKNYCQTPRFYVQHFKWWRYLHICEKNGLLLTKNCLILFNDILGIQIKNWNFFKTSFISAFKIKILKIGDNMADSTVWFDEDWNILLHVWGSLGSVTLALLQQCTSTTLLRSLDTQQYWTALASLAGNNVNKQHCYARNNRQAFPRSQDCCLRTSTDIFSACLEIA